MRQHHATSIALGIVRAVAWIVPSAMRNDWRREWESELVWAAASGRGPITQLRRGFGASRHALWLRRQQVRRTIVTNDFRYALRALRGRPFVTSLAVVSLALGIGANVGIFTVVNAALFRPLPFADAARIIQYANGESAAALSGPEVVDLVRDSRALASIGWYSMAEGNVTGGRQDAERARIARVSAGFFDVLRPAFAAGRGIAADEDRPGADLVAVIAEPLAIRYFGSAASAVGGRLMVNGAPRTVVGVVPHDFGYPAATISVWSPLQLNPAAPGERRNHQYRVIGRLAPGANVASAQAEIDSLKSQWAAANPDAYDPANPLVTTVRSMPDRLLGATRPYLMAMLGAVALVLLIACVNVASLLVTHGEARRRDLAVSIAMGASRARLAMRSIAESLFLAAAGSLAGLALAWPISTGLIAMAPASIPRVADAAIDARVFLFGVGMAVVTAVVSGLLPLVHTLRDADAAMLRTGRSAGPAGGRATERLHALLVAGEVALAVTLLGGAGLLTHSLMNLTTIDLGFTPDGVLTARISLPRPAYDDTRGAGAVQQIVDRLGHAPAVTHAAAMAWTPVIDGGGMWSVEGEGRVDGSGPEVPLAAPQQVTPGWFQAMGIPLLRGRDVAITDHATAEPVVVVNESFGRMFWGDADPVGHRMKVSSPDKPWVTIVGVVPDTRVEGVTEAAPPVMYFPHAQASVGSYFTQLNVTLVARYTGASAPVAGEIRRLVREIDPNVPVSDVRSLDDIVGSTIDRERFTGWLVSGFALLAALLAGVGIYGVIAYGVAQRRFEIGLRMALGASSSRILGSIARRGLVAAGVGLIVGIAGAAAAGRMLQTVLFNVTPLDAGALGAAAGFAAAVILIALLGPSRRALGVHPSTALRG